jgi:hypothetical protein
MGAESFVLDISIQPHPHRTALATYPSRVSSEATIALDGRKLRENNTPSRTKTQTPRDYAWIYE